MTGSTLTSTSILHSLDDEGANAFSWPVNDFPSF